VLPPPVDLRAGRPAQLLPPPWGDLLVVGKPLLWNGRPGWFSSSAGIAVERRTGPPDRDAWPDSQLDARIESFAAKIGNLAPDRLSGRRIGSYMPKDRELGARIEGSGQS